MGVVRPGPIGDGSDSTSGSSSVDDSGTADGAGSANDSGSSTRWALSEEKSYQRFGFSVRELGFRKGVVLLLKRGFVSENAMGNALAGWSGHFYAMKFWYDK